MVRLRCAHLRIDETLNRPVKASAKSQVLATLRAKSAPSNRAILIRGDFSC
jgi:hypothetical protein